MNVIFGLVIITNDTAKYSRQTNVELIALENASKDRTIIENNVDTIITQTLITIVLLEKTNIPASKELINLNLLNYLQDKAFATDLLLLNQSRLNLLHINNSTQLEVYKTQGLTYANFYFTGGENLENNISSELGNSIKLIFKIPKGYTKKVIG